MAVGQFEVVPAATVKPGQSVGRIALFDSNGDPWAPGGESEPAAVAWEDVTGKPSTFTPAAHTHEIADVEGQEAINNDFEARITALEAAGGAA